MSQFSLKKNSPQNLYNYAEVGHTSFHITQLWQAFNISHYSQHIIIFMHSQDYFRGISE